MFIPVTVPSRTLSAEDGERGEQRRGGVALGVVVAWRLSSRATVPARPFFTATPGWVRSSAWIWLCSSTDRTTACAGSPREAAARASGGRSRRPRFEGPRDARRPGLVGEKPVDALGHEALLPAPHACLRLARLGHDRVGPGPRRAEKHDPGSPAMLVQALRGATTALSRLRPLADSVNMIPVRMRRLASNPPQEHPTGGLF